MKRFLQPAAFILSVLLLCACGSHTAEEAKPSGGGPFVYMKVSGSSMQPAIDSGELVLIDRNAYKNDLPQRGDIILCSFPGSGSVFIKRVTGTPGDTLAVTDGVLYVNSEALNEYFSGVIASDMNTVTVPEGFVFVTGDNINDSRDSRDPGVGPIPLSNISGRVTFIVWPLDKFRML